MNKTAQKLLADPRVEDFENEAMDDGRWMLSLNPGWCFHQSAHEGDIVHGKSVGGAVEGLKALREARPCSCVGCQRAAAAKAARAAG